MSDDLQLVHRTLTGIPGFTELAADAYTTDKLGGLTNLVFRIDTGKDRQAIHR